MTKRSFQPVPLSSMQTNMGNPGFSALAANDLGSDGTAADGFDSIFNQLATNLVSDNAVLSGLNLLLPAMDYSADPVQSPQWSSAVSQFSGIQAQADSMFAQTAQVLGAPAGTVTPPPIKAPTASPIVTAPVHGGGGGGTSAAGGAPTQVVSYSLQGATVSATVTYVPPPTHEGLKDL